ncbi:hypothetical protein [Parvibaculum sp.]|uniref:hypothetical protein n=1 Tax=Parvibaculum sp. TaxID=2024848 RepID=UPI0032997915
MSIESLDVKLRTMDAFSHIDMGFLNRRLCLTALPNAIRDVYFERAKVGDDHLTRLNNDHLLVTMLLDVCDAVHAPTLLVALEENKPKLLFRSTEQLEPCPNIYDEPRVRHKVVTDLEFSKPVFIAYHTEHLVSSTGKMNLAEGSFEAIVGLLHNKEDCYEIEPLVIGAPWLDHPRNGPDGARLMWFGREFGEILPEDIQQFVKLKDVDVDSADEWLNAMKHLPEKRVKEAFAELLAEPTKKDWGGETNDHFSSSIVVNGNRCTGAFLLKGPTNFREMTLDMCGKRADQILRLAESGADVSVVQHSHVVGEAVRKVLRSLVVHPGKHRKFCIIDGKTTYRILKAYEFL